MIFDMSRSFEGVSRPSYTYLSKYK